MSKEMKVSAAVKKDPKTYDSITKLSNPELLQLVRLSWMAQSQQYLSPSGLQFVQSVVEPCLKCVVHRVPDNLADVIAKFSQCIASGQCTDSEVARIKIACGAIDGSMEDHPLLSGISLQCLRMLEKAERGIMTLKGRRSSESNYTRLSSFNKLEFTFPSPVGTEAWRRSSAYRSTAFPPMSSKQSRCHLQLWRCRGRASLQKISCSPISAIWRVKAAVSRRDGVGIL